MMPTVSSSLDSLFTPRSIAFIGLSERAHAPATRGLRHCRRLGFEGPMFGINPRHASLHGLPCHASLAALDQPVDLAVVALDAAASLDAVAECVEHGVGSVMVCSAGWGEAGPQGQARSEALARLLRQGDTRLLGPNCIGVGNAAAGLCMAYNSSFEHFAFRHRWPVGMVCQSGAMLGGMLLNAEDSGFGVEAFVHVGNGLDLSLEEAAAHLLARDDIHALALMIEGLSPGGGFEALALQARDAGKRIAVFKAGRSDAGRVAVASHTGALAGSDDLFDAFCDELGVLRVREPEDLLPAAGMLSRWRRPRGRGVLVCSLSGGAASVLADELSDQMLELPGLDARTIDACEALAPRLLHAHNPLDVGSTVFSDPGIAGRALALACADPAIDAACWVGVGAPRDERSSALLEDAVARLAASNKPAVIVALSGHGQEAGFAAARAAGIPVARSLHAAAVLLSAALHTAPSAPPAQPASAEPPGPAPLPEQEARALLRSHGLPMLITEWAETPDEAERCARGMPAPVVLKGMVPGIAHKTEAGLVALELRTAEAVGRAARAMLARHPTLTGFSVERMVSGGIETMVGVRNDPQLGPMLAFGLGGIGVEVLRDIAFRRCPLDRAGALGLIKQTRAGRLLHGFRGKPAADVDALAEALIALSRFAHLHRDVIAEVEINPLIVLETGHGVHAVDALVVRQDTTAPTPRRHSCNDAS
ncbi:acetate--CoA ligase family protein [Verticiella sediminum]|uniref:Acetate--CoA ligase family protein n=1 Tax=Verticiella sediminum TaxID=1247510 RepID=A0A556A7Q4_9BURK|nr:acetate--CoA ligase family protein [Verticiella sediminum]TSH88921.1 acetate--CoA ligase family protein [Verticiella sediminum]